MKLVDFIERNHEPILAEWEAFAQELLPGEHEGSTLRDHGEEILQSVATDMRTRQTEPQRAAKSKKRRRPEGEVARVATAHAEVRFESGLRLDDLVAEYRALRASVLRLWGEASGTGDVEEVTRFNEAIDEALMEATSRYMEMLARRRGLLLGVLGHDLRNPLDAIALGASTLAARGSLDAKDAHIASRISSSAKRMGRLISDLLDLTRGRAGIAMPVEPKPADLGDVCREVIEELRTAHPEVEVRLQASGDLHGEWDGQRLAQVVSNLVGNAIQHGERGAGVEVAVRDDEGAVVLEVHNEGRPIPREAFSAIFDPYRSAPGEGHAIAHVGLGLYVVEQIVKAHGGSIGVTSTKSAGTTFTVRLPRVARHEEGKRKLRSVA